jgi:predicted extracellular nuclease
VIIEGVVVGDFQESNQIGGFHVQEEDAEADTDPETSEGIYVFAPNAIDVSIGDTVRVTGSVSEFFDLTELSTFDTDAVELIDPVGTATPATLTLPFAAVDDFERYEGMGVVLPQSLVIAEYFNYDRFGEIVLSSERHLQPTAEFAPGSSEAIAAADLIARDRITLDDGQPDQNPDFSRHPNGDAFSLTNRFRGGDTLTDVFGVMDFAFGDWKIQPTGPATYANANPRPPSPADVGGDITVASFNVLNYYTTLDESGAQCFPSNTRSDCRGADDAGEFARQRAKIIAALAAIDADVVGLIEIENNEGVATADLVAGLNDVLGAGTYAYVDAGRIGTDTIAVAMVYKPGTVTPAGAHAILDTPAFLDPANTGEDRNRAALAQTFTENVTGESFTAVINHLKSKSGSEIDDDPDGICVDADPGNDTLDCDQGDGQSFFNYTRTLAAQELAAWLATDPTGSGDPDILVLGDLNSYDHEDPIGVLEGAGYTDLVGAFGGEGAYSFVFDGQIGYLDYGMANASLLPAVTGTTVWHLNADEPDLLDYDTSFKSDGQDAIFDPTTPFRASDHDPVLVGLALAVDVAQLLDDVAALEADGVLNAGQANALSQKLASAQRQIERGDVNGARGMVTAFVNQVAGLVGSGILSAEQGASLTGKAEVLLAGI